MTRRVTPRSRHAGRRHGHPRRKCRHEPVNADGEPLVANPSSARNLSRSQWRVVALASLGGSLEFYDFVIYGVFAQYIARQFFPADDYNVSSILSFSVLALGFLARPLGGIVLSGLGDRFGRRPVFLGSLCSP